MLPDSIGNMRHLRYLNLRRSAIKNLPESICCLYELQTLQLRGCYEFWKLPRGISKLINLRHLDVDPGCLSGVVGIGNLTCLQELESFPISEEGKGPKIDDLKEMNELRGTLSIQNLQWVRSKEEAMGAMLDRKRHLIKLEVEWEQKATAGHRNSKLDEEILEALVPPAGLKDFVIKGYDGEKAPRWLDQQSLSNLESISLNTCRNWRSLPISLCMSSLRKTYISGCSQLRYLPSLPATLKELVIYDVGLEELPEFYHPRPGSGNSIIPSLSILEINCCGSLKSLQAGLLRHHLRNLTVLRIQHCYQLVDWPKGAGFLATLLSLQEDLCIEDCPKLEAFPAGFTLSPSLEHLVVTDSPDVVNKALLAQLNNLSSESSLSVEKDYTNLASCYDQSLHLVCGKERVWSWRCDDWVHAWRVQIWPRRNTPKLDMEARTPPFNIVPPERRKGSVSPCSCEPLLPWASSVRWLAVDGIFHAAFLPFQMPSLEGLWISRFRGTVPLLSDDLLSHLTVLMELQIFDCPELTLSSLKEMISSLPSLLHLTVERCPKLTSSSPSCALYAATSSSNAAKLQTLFVDDGKVIGDAQFVRDCLSCLCGLHIWYDRNLTSFTTAMEEGLRSLGRSLQHLSFNDCDKLDDLSSDMPSILPSLKALSIRRCKKLCSLPTGGLPALLGILVLHHCGGKLEMQCNAPPPLARQAQQQTYWPKIAHVPVILNDGCLVQGSYMQFLELRAKWRDF